MHVSLVSITIWCVCCLSPLLHSKGVICLFMTTACVCLVSMTTYCVLLFSAGSKWLADLSLLSSTIHCSQADPLCATLVVCENEWVNVTLLMVNEIKRECSKQSQQLKLWHTERKTNNNKNGHIYTWNISLRQIALVLLFFISKKMLVHTWNMHNAWTIIVQATDKITLQIYWKNKTHKSYIMQTKNYLKDKIPTKE